MKVEKIQDGQIQDEGVKIVGKMTRDSSSSWRAGYEKGFVKQVTGKLVNICQKLFGSQDDEDYWQISP